MIDRNLMGALGATKKSCLLLGPRQVGKSTLIASLGPGVSINLTDEAQFYRFSADPGALRAELEANASKTVFIDEIQRLPSLLNTVQALIDERKDRRFFLTGSSARKLRSGGANLLPGRVLMFHLGGLVASELSYQADTPRILRVGALPEAYLEEDDLAARRLLQSYVHTYLREEIKAEALTRNLEAFTRFIEIAFAESGQFIDYSKFARRARVSRHALSRFYEIFEDTLVGQRVLPFEPLADAHDLIKHPRFYAFDLGVYNAMLGNFEASRDRIGVLAEHLIFTQLLHSAWSKQIECKLSTYRTRGGSEVDFIAELDREVVAIEVKTSDSLDESDVRHLLAFRRAYPKAREAMVMHLGKRRLKIANVWCLPWQEALQKLGL
jgi:uncharacterized protein